MPETTDPENNLSAVAPDPVETAEVPSRDGGEPEPAEGSGLSEPMAEGAGKEDTGVTSQNQAETKAPLPPKPPETLAERMARRQAQVEADLYDREAFVLKYVREKFSTAYYNRAKTEGNEFFNQAVIYRLRRHRHGKTPSKR